MYPPLDIDILIDILILLILLRNISYILENKRYKFIYIIYIIIYTYYGLLLQLILWFLEI